ncbi:MAG: prefoldin subunit beta [Thaumarchaeota archaeon]|nr:prefoldin subunit beta [Nitrososphaerota archaeon]
MSTQEVPPWLREQLVRFEQLQQNLQAILVQKQQVEVESAEVEKALAELTKMGSDGIVYKSAGSLLVKVNKDDIQKELQERKDLANTRSAVLAKQEQRVRESAKEVQNKIDEVVRARQQPTGS